MHARAFFSHSLVPTYLNMMTYKKYFVSHSEKGKRGRKTKEIQQNTAQKAQQELKLNEASAQMVASRKKGKFIR